MSQVDKTDLPVSVEQAKGIVESVQGKGAVSDEAITIAVRYVNGEISSEQAIEMIKKLHNVG